MTKILVMALAISAALPAFASTSQEDEGAAGSCSVSAIAITGEYRSYVKVDCENYPETTCLKQIQQGKNLVWIAVDQKECDQKEAEQK